MILLYLICSALFNSPYSEALNPARTFRKIVATPVTVTIEGAKLIKEGIYGTIDVVKTTPDTVDRIKKIPEDIKQASSESILAAQTRIEDASKAYRSAVKAVAPENLFSYYLKGLRNIVLYVYDIFDTKGMMKVDEKKTNLKIG